MPCTRLELAQLADALLKVQGELDPGSNESVVRASTSRAYYALYHLLGQLRHKLLGSAGAYQHGEGSHRTLFADLNTGIAKLPSRDDRNILMAEIGNAEIIRKRRVRADYFLDDSVSLAHAKSTLQLTQMTIKRLEKFL